MGLVLALFALTEGDMSEDDADIGGGGARTTNMLFCACLLVNPLCLCDAKRVRLGCPIVHKHRHTTDFDQSGDSCVRVRVLVTNQK